MVYIIIGLVAGGAVSMFTKNMLVIDLEFSVYVFLLILALASALTDFVSKKNIEKLEIRYCTIHMFIDIIIALTVSFISERIGLPLYLAVVFVFGNKMYKNILKITEGFLAK